mmetsp:Transcript_14516/g.31524  ORF Transcript_14516/g.31524 Transcript_14516/m.31524 type:complete len:371 (+) Transcript_14516:214-1326(+)
MVWTSALFPSAFIVLLAASSTSVFFCHALSLIAPQRNTKVWMLGNRNTSMEYERDRFTEEANKRSIDFSVVHSNEFHSVVSGPGGDRSTIVYNNDIVSLPDAVLARTGSGTGSASINLLRQLERLNVTTLPNSASIQASMNKMYANQILSQANIPIPKTMLAHLPETSSALVHRIIGFPCVLKVVSGSLGKGVHLCHTPKEFDDLSEMMCSVVNRSSLPIDIVVQEFVDFSAGRDIRVMVIGDRVVGAMQRTAIDGDFKANVSRGGEVTAFPIDRELEQLSLDVAKTLDMDIAGIDLLFHPDGYKVCEANSAPGFKGFEEALQVNVPSMMLDFVSFRAKADAGRASRVKTNKNRNVRPSKRPIRSQKHGY